MLGICNLVEFWGSSCYGKTEGNGRIDGMGKNLSAGTLNGNKVYQIFCIKILKWVSSAGICNFIVN